MSTPSQTVPLRKPCLRSCYHGELATGPVGLVLSESSSFLSPEPCSARAIHSLYIPLLLEQGETAAPHSFPRVLAFKGPCLVRLLLEISEPGFQLLTVHHYLRPRFLNVYLKTIMYVHADVRHMIRVCTCSPKIRDNGIRRGA